MDGQRRLRRCIWRKSRPRPEAHRDCLCEKKGTGFTRQLLQAVPEQPIPVAPMVRRRRAPEGSDTGSQRRKRNGWILPRLTLQFSPLCPLQVEARRSCWMAVLGEQKTRLSSGPVALGLAQLYAGSPGSPAHGTPRAGRSCSTSPHAVRPTPDDLAHATGFEPHVLVVTRRECTAAAWRSRVPEAGTSARWPSLRRGRLRRSQGGAPKPVRVTPPPGRARPRLTGFCSSYGHDLCSVFRGKLPEPGWPKLLRGLRGLCPKTLPRQNAPGLDGGSRCGKYLISRTPSCRTAVAA